MHPLTKTAIILAGYLAALALALAVTIAYRYIAPNTDPSNGMRDFGDALLFCTIFGLVSLLPTGLAFYFLRRVGWFWFIAVATALALNALGILTLLTIRQRLTGTIESLTTFGVLTVLGSPVLTLGFLAGAVLTAIRAARYTLLGAAGMQALLFLAYFTYATRSVR